MPASAGETLIHCAWALSLIPHFEFSRMSQSLGVGNRLPALRGCAFLLHLSITPNQDFISFECLSSRAHFSPFLSNVSAPACPVHRICSACASILTSPQPWSYYAVPVNQFCSPPSPSIRCSLCTESEPPCSRMQGMTPKSGFQKCELHHQNAPIIIDAQAQQILTRRLSNTHPVQLFCSAQNPHNV